MEAKPHINTELTTADKAIELIGWILIALIWTLVIVNFSGLPGTIPVHYTVAGIPDRLAGKESIFILPAVASVLYLGLTYLCRFPHIFNYPVRINHDNALRHYTIATRLIRHLKISIAVIFGLLTFQTIETANGGANGLGGWLLPAMMMLIFTPVAYYAVKTVKAKE